MYGQVTADGHHSNPTGWKRWAYSTNHKDIRTLYMLYRIFAGLIRTAISIYIRFELTLSCNNFTIDNHSFNVITTAHAIVMIFFFLIPTLISRFGN
jgi:cytochrome c oxidase subunit 1